MEVCPECGSGLAAERRHFDGGTVTVAICKRHPDCDYFYWTLPEGENFEGGEDFETLMDWAVGKSLPVLRRSRWEIGQVSLRNLFESPGGEDRG